jgi:hypothetical protein
VVQNASEMPPELIDFCHLYLNSNQEELNASDKGLQTLPESIGNLVNLTWLHLDYNQLQTLPESIENLVNLKRLDLGSNRLQALPESIGNLVNLTSLGLNYNQLQSIPESIGSLANLTSLGLNNNRLQTLPESIGNLAKLTYLGLINNRFQTLPESIGSLVNLKALKLQNNQFTSIPECLFRLSTNCRIDLGGNPLNEEEIARLRQRVNQPGYQGPQFIFSVHESRPQQMPTRSFESTLPNWCDETCQNQLLAKLPELVKTDLSNWFSRIQEIPYYTSNPAAAKSQIALFLNWLASEENQDNLQGAYTILSQATSTCGDRVALSVNELLLHVKLC